MERHRTHREPLLAQWLRERVPALARRTIPDIEDCVWPAVVSLSPRLGVSAVLDRLVADGIPLCAVSNAAFSGRVLRGELDRHGLADSFQFVVSSADLDSRKPAPLIFTTAIAQLGVAASTAWFVGDTVSEDIVGAARAGLLPIWFCNTPSRDAPHANVPVLYAWADFVALYEASIVAQQRV
jgi:FMN phosphatase YigB (HAD superfamily)